MVSHEAWDTMAANHQTHLIPRLGQLDNLSAQQATSLTAAVSALPFRDELKQQLSQAVSDTLLRRRGGTPRGTPRARDFPQFSLSQGQTSAGRHCHAL